MALDAEWEHLLMPMTAIKFEGGFEAQKSVERPVGTSQDKGKRAVDLPQVVVTLDGQEIHHKDENVKDSIASFQFEESDEDTGHAAVAHVNLQVRSLAGGAEGVPSEPC